MSDLAATNCGGCGCNEGGCSSILWIILLLSCCCGNNGGLLNGNNGCGSGNDCLWIILLLLCCGGCGGGCGNGGGFCSARSVRPYKKERGYRSFLYVSWEITASDFPLSVRLYFSSGFLPVFHRPHTLLAPFSFFRHSSSIS